MLVGSEHPLQRKVRRLKPVNFEKIKAAEGRFFYLMDSDKLFTFYILYSSTRNRFYIGYTGERIEERLRRHNSNHSGFTGSVNDWTVVYAETFSEKSLAAKREREVKAWKSRARIEKLIGKVADSEHPA